MSDTSACKECGATATRHFWNCPIWDRLEALFDERKRMVGR